MKHKELQRLIYEKWQNESQTYGIRIYLRTFKSNTKVKLAVRKVTKYLNGTEYEHNVKSFDLDEGLLEALMDALILVKAHMQHGTPI